MRCSVSHTRNAEVGRVINRFPRQPTLLLTRFLRQRPVVDAHHRDGWTRIFGGKASEQKTFRPVEKRNFTYPTCVWYRS